MTTLERIRAARRHRQSRRRRLIAGLGLLIAALVALSLMLGQSLTPPLDVLRVLAGQDVPGASFTVGTLRLPRAVMALLAGAAFGMGGVAFQIMLRNALASPDIIGISTGASAAAVLAIILGGLGGAIVPVLAVAAGLAVALAIYGLSWRGGVAGTRLILIGIGVAAMLNSLIAYTLSRAPAWDLQQALRWLSGSVNGAQLSQAVPLAVTLALAGGLLLYRAPAISRRCAWARTPPQHLACASA